MQPAKNLLFSSLLFSSLLFSSLLFSSAAQAASEDGGRGPYVQADLAYAYEHITHDYPKPTAPNKNKISTVSDYFRNIRTRSVHPRVSVGYDFGGWRIAADYARYRKWNNSKYSVNTKNLRTHESNGNRQDLKTENQENGTFHAVSSLGLSAVYDFDTGSRFKPYAGVRVAYGHVKHQVHSVEKETTLTILTPSKDATEPGKIILGPISKPAHHESRSISSLGFGAVAGVGIDITPNLTLD
ncbi:outer membrane beta-barrel protein, partial [Neisseria gonorrhoeae]